LKYKNNCCDLANIHNLKNQVFAYILITLDLLFITFNLHFDFNLILFLPDIYILIFCEYSSHLVKFIQLPATIGAGLLEDIFIDVKYG
jgi:hypothetical protein